jgi:hypothetical protein
MASVEVFVDDAVRGRLPRVCAKTGVATTGHFRVEQSRGGVGFSWLLVFLGPIGWIVFLVIALTSPREVFTVRLPYAESAVHRELGLARARLIALLVAGGLAIVAVLGVPPLPRLGWLVAALVALLVAVALTIRLTWIQVDVRLDASRRWVTLTGVHPAFARAVRARDGSSEEVHTDVQR